MIKRIQNCQYLIVRRWNIRRKQFSTIISKSTSLEGPSLKDFIALENSKKQESKLPHTNKYENIINPNRLKFHIETYGCQMNLSDSEIITSILQSNGHVQCNDILQADLILTNTCAIRENAETKVWHRLDYFQSIRRKNRVGRFKKSGFYPLVGVVGCMAERLKEKLLHKDSVDFVCGPDAYRDINRLLNSVISTDQKAANTQLSLEETYADINPVREINSNSAFVSIMRGCNNMCSFCIVPFTRGRERSRPMSSILQEVQSLLSTGVKEIVLLGQNVNGYHDISQESAELYPESSYKVTPGFNNLNRTKKRDLPGARFPDLLQTIASINPELRIRFTSPHPKDFPDDLLSVIASNHNICSSIHLPLQSGSNTVLTRMRRGYTRESFFDLVTRARAIIPNLSISTDIITGFCDETEEEHLDTLELMKRVRFDQAFMFAYSLREKTHAAHTMTDNVTPETKNRRLREVIDVYRSQLHIKNYNEEIGQIRVILIEGYGTKSTPEHPMLTGRTDGNKRVVLPAHDVITTNYLFSQLSHNNKLQDQKRDNNDNNDNNDISMRGDEMELRNDHHKFLKRISIRSSIHSNKMNNDRNNDVISNIQKVLFEPFVTGNSDNNNNNNDNNNNSNNIIMEEEEEDISPHTSPSSVIPSISLESIRKYCNDSIHHSDNSDDDSNTHSRIRMINTVDLIGHYVIVRMVKANSPTLRGVGIMHITLADFEKYFNHNEII
eukprot:gene10499-14110_t